MRAARDHRVLGSRSQLSLCDNHVRPLKRICGGVIPAQFDRMQRVMALARSERAGERRSAIHRKGLAAS